MKSNYIKIENHPELVKDKESGAILNVDNNAMNQYKINRSKKILEQKRLNKLEDDVFLIKKMLQQLLEEKNK